MKGLMKQKESKLLSGILLLMLVAVTLKSNAVEEYPESAQELAEPLDDYLQEVDDVDLEDSSDAVWDGFNLQPEAAGLPGSASNPYLIEAEEDLAQLAVFVNGNQLDSYGQYYSELYYKLTRDLNLSNYTQWVPIGIYTHDTVDYATDITTPARGNYRKPFKGNFDGSGYTISNIKTGKTYNSTYGYTRGLFGLLEDAVVTNLTIKDAVIEGRGSSGILAGYSLGGVQVRDCVVAGTVSTTGAYAGTGGAIGYMTTEKDGIQPLLINVRADVTVTSQLGTGRTGGLIGYVRSGNESYSNTSRASWKSSLLIENCEVSGSIAASNHNLGGLIGEIYFRYSNSNTVQIKQCKMSAVITGNRSYNTGGLIGYINSYYADDNKIILDSCNVQSPLIKTTAGEGYRVGGAVGSVAADHSHRNDIRVADSHTTVDELKLEAIGAYDLGGLVGYYYVNYSEYNKLSISTSSVSGNVISNSGTSSGTTAGTGGLIGSVRYNYLNWTNGNNGVGFNQVDIRDCDVYTKEIRGNTDNIGGLIGLFHNYKSDDGRLEINNTNVHSDAVYGYSSSANRVYNRRVGGAIGWYRVEGEAVTSGTLTNDPASYRADRTYFEMKNCLIEADVYTECSDGYEVGGIAGYLYVYYAPYSEVYLNRCVSKGAVSTSGAGSYRVGGIAGIMNIYASSYNKFAMTECEAYGNVKTTGTGAYKVGGVLGELLYGGGYKEAMYQGLHASVQCEADIIDCHSYAAEVSATGAGAYYVGGLIGVTDLNVFANRTRLLVDSCSAAGDVSAGSYYVGGLIGFCENVSPYDTTDRAPVNSSDMNPNADINAHMSMYTTIRNSYATGNVYGGSPNNTNNWGTNAGGLIGHCHAGDDLPHDAMLIENCYATGDVSIQVSTGYNAGGLIGRPSKNVTVKNSYATGDIYSPGNNTGGLIGYAEGHRDRDNHMTVKNSYATGNVVGGGEGTGGLIGQAQHTFVENSYATGSVYNTSSASRNFAGGLIGWLTYGGRITNSYATGHVDAKRETNAIGGFIGHRDGLLASYPLYISDCLYDQTTAQTERGIGTKEAGENYFYAVENGLAVTDVIGRRTSNMVSYQNYNESFSRWGMVNNNCVIPASKGSGTSEEPWYIDNNITYPYLYYQADGFTTALNTEQYKPDRTDDTKNGNGYLNDIRVDSKARNYYLATVGSSAAVNGSYTVLAGKRVDYNSNILTALNSQYKAVTAGAVKAYFPYQHGSSLVDYNKHQYWFDAEGAAYIPAAGLYRHTAETLYSFGAVSQTNITAFMNGPFADKSSDRIKWTDGEPETYTYVGQTVEYTVQVGNYSTLAAWNNVILTDPLAYGITLLDGEVSADYGPGTEPVTHWDGSGTAPEAPYYTYKKGEDGSDLEGCYILEVYLGDFPEAQINGNDLEAQKCEVRFKVRINREAATEFLEDGTWEGDNIRNRGTVTGKFVSTDGSFDEEVPIGIDDHNTDPVYDSYLIRYNSNYDPEDEQAEGNEEQIKAYCLSDGTGNHEILPNEEPADGGDYTGFSLAGYSFNDWYYYDSDGTTRIDAAPGETITGVDRDITLYARWKRTDFPFVFYKTDGKEKFLINAEFELYIWTGGSAPASDELVTADNTTPGKWQLYDSVVSDEQGNVSFRIRAEDFGNIYQLAEIRAPDYYKTPEGQWRFAVNAGDTMEEVLHSITAIKGANGETPPAFKIIDNNEELQGQLSLVNFRQYLLPDMGGRGIMLLTLIGVMLLIIGIAWAAARKGRRISNDGTAL